MRTILTILIVSLFSGCASTSNNHNNLSDIVDEYFNVYSHRNDFERLMSFYDSNAQFEDIIYGNSFKTKREIQEFLAWDKGEFTALSGDRILTITKQIQEGNPITITDPKMTRFLMSLDEAVELVLFAFENGNPGDLFVNKAPAGTIGDLAQALKELCQADTEIKIIGTRHGEKLYETLCTREEMVKAEDMGDFYRIPADNRDLNYAQYFSEGEQDVSVIEDYHSHNTVQQDVEGMKLLLSKLPLIRKEIFGEEYQMIVF